MDEMEFTEAESNMNDLVSEYQPRSSATPRPSRNCSRGSPSSSPPCSGGRLSFTGTQGRAWTTWCPSTSSTRRQPSMTMSKSSRKNTTKNKLKLYFLKAYMYFEIEEMSIF